jgi:hypothetical protein
MARPRKIKEQARNHPAEAGPGPNSDDKALGEQLIREGREGHAEFVAGWTKFMEEVGIQGKPLGAKKLRAMLLQSGIKPDANEFSRGIIAMREE